MGRAHPPVRHWYQGLDIETQDDVAGIMLDIGYLTQKLHEEADKLRKFLH
jgi:hypothetical protein